MSKNYIEVFPRVFMDYKEELNDDITEYRIKGLPKGYIHYYMNLEDSFKVIGIGECILNKDVVEAKKNFYLSASMRKVIFQKRNLEDYMEGDYAYRFCEEIDAIFMALLSGDEALISSMINISGKKKESDEVKEVSQIYIYNRLNAIKYIILKDFKNAKECIKEITKISGDAFMKPYLDNEKILSAIIENDENELNKALKNMAKNNKKLKQYKGSPEELFCLAALGLAKLAALNGMKVELDEPSAPKEMLEKSDIIYPKVDFVD